MQIASVSQANMRLRCLPWDEQMKSKWKGRVMSDNEGPFMKRLSFGESSERISDFKKSTFIFEIKPKSRPSPLFPRQYMLPFLLHRVTFPRRRTRACIAENVCENQSEVTHKNTHVCFWSLYLMESYSFLLIPSLLGCQTFDTNVRPLSSSSDLFLDLPWWLWKFTPSVAASNRGRAVSLE